MENFPFTMIEVVCTGLNALVVILDLTVHRWFQKIAGGRHNYEIFKWSAGVFSSAISFILTVLISVFAILSATDSRLVGFVELIACALTTGIHAFIEFRKFYKNELEKKTYKSYDGVFAASAIMVTKDKKFLLVTRKEESTETDKLWVQPGIYYRTNALHKQPPALEPFYDQLVASIEAECGLIRSRYRPIKLNSIILENQNTLPENGLALWNAEYNKNHLSQTPFLIQVEEAEVKKRSDTKRHIDCFYAFELTIDDEPEFLQRLREASSSGAKYDELRTFTYEEIEKMCGKEKLHRDGAINRCYPDLAAILEKFRELWRKELFEKMTSIRYCTFNPANNTIWLRLNNNCNLNCEFCLMVNKSPQAQTVSCDLDKFASFWNGLDIFKDHPSYHLIVTGGEPLLVKDLCKIIDYANKNSHGRINSITICTNGTLGTSNAEDAEEYEETAKSNLDKLLSCSFTRKLKFVINMSSYDSRSFSQITGAQGELLNQQKAFIQKLRTNNLHNITANVVMTDMLRENPKSYFDLWRELGITNIAFSYAIQLGMDCRGGSMRINTLSKEDCLELYCSLGNGQYPIEWFDRIELMIPSCDEKSACKENKKIISCYLDPEQNWQRKNGCLDV